MRAKRMRERESMNRGVGVGSAVRKKSTSIKLGKSQESNTS